MRPLTKNSREELLSMVERLRARETEMDMKVDALESEAARLRGDYERVRGRWQECSGTRWWSVMGYAVGVAALAWCCYLVGADALVWPWAR